MKFWNGINFISYSINVNHLGFIDQYFPNYYGIQFNCYGKFLFSCGSAELKNYDGSYAFITHPGKRFRYGAAPETLERSHNFVCFAGERIKEYIKGGLLPIGLGEPIFISNSEKFQLTFNELVNVANCPPLGNDCAINLLESLLLQFQQARLAPQCSIPQQKIGRLVEAMHKTPEYDWDFVRTAKELHLSFAHFRRLFKQLNGQPVQHYLNKLRLKKASSMLRETNIPIKDISAQLGFNDRFYFSQCFKRHFQLSPGAYRKEFKITV